MILLTINRLFNSIAAVDYDILTVDHGRGAAGQKNGDSRNLIGVGETAVWNFPYHRFAPAQAQAFFPSSVSTTVGLIALTLIPNLAHSQARTLVIEITAAFDAQ